MSIQAVAERVFNRRAYVKITLLIIMASSIAFQFLAAFMAVRLIPLSGAFIAWVFLACAFIVQAMRRLVSLNHVLSDRSPGDMPVEIMGLVISILMVLGIWKFRPLFNEIKRSKQAMSDKQDELLEINRQLEEEVTERRKVEKALKESELLYRHLYNDTPVMLHSIDHNGRLVSVSNYWIDTLGFKRSEVLGRRTSEFLTDKSRRYAEEVILPEFFRTGVCKEVPYQFVKKSGEILDVLLSAIAEKDDEGKIVRSLAVIIDVTERKKAQKEIEKLNIDLAERAVELENTNRELEAFSYSVSHDLRTPLTVIGGFSQLIQKLSGQNLDSQSLEYLDIIYSSTLSMEKLIDALLNFSMLTRVELHRKEFDLGAIAHMVAAELAITDPDRQATFLISKGVTANGDADLLRIVLENLLGNAWKFTSNQEEVTIEFGMMDAEGGQIYYVRDNGPGFAMDHADKLFTPFHRLYDKETEGHGIGLSTVERIIKRHGGKVWAEGEPGKGATFYFTLCFPERVEERPCQE